MPIFHVFLAILFVSSTALFQLKSPSTRKFQQFTTKMLDNRDSIANLQLPVLTKFTKIVSTTLLSASLLYGPISIDNFIGVINPIPIAPVHAEFRAAQKRTYFRFIPKLEIGRDYFKKDLKEAIDNEKWDVITKFFETYVSKYNYNDPTQVDATDTYVNAYLYRPMTIFSGTFAERGSSTKQRLLLEQKMAFENAMSDLEGCVKNRRAEGFFGGEIKMPTGPAKKKQALDAWNRGKVALNEYITIANNGLMLELKKIDTI